MGNALRYIIMKKYAPLITQFAVIPELMLTFFFTALTSSSAPTQFLTLQRPR